MARLVGAALLAATLLTSVEAGPGGAGRDASGTLMASNAKQLKAAFNQTVENDETLFVRFFMNG